MAQLNEGTTIAADLPAAIFLDTNILDELPESLQSGDLASLVENVRHVYVPDLVAREWLEHRLEKAIKSLESASKATKHLSQYSDNWEVPKVDLEVFLRTVRRTCIRRLRDAGIRVMRPPVVSLRSLTLKATRKIPPFGHRGVGFKDELILQSIVKLLSRWNYGSVILISQDSDFGAKEIKRTFADAGVKFTQVRSISDAFNTLDKLLDVAVKHEITQSELEVRKLAEEQQDRIFEFVRRRSLSDGISEYILRPSGEMLGRYSIVYDRIVSVTPIAIAQVRIGQVHPPSGRTLVTIHVRCEIEVEITEMGSLPRLMGRKINEKGRKSDLQAANERKQVSLERDISVEATAVNQDGRSWTDLQIVEDEGEYGRMLLDVVESLRANQNT